VRRPRLAGGASIRKFLAPERFVAAACHRYRRPDGADTEAVNLGGAALPVLRGLRGSRGRDIAPAMPAATPIEVADRSPDDAWRRRRIEAFAVLDEARLLQGYRLATLILRNRDEAEDATQEAIAQAWLRWETLRDTSRFDAWFDRILVNICRNRLRHARTIRIVPIDDAMSVPGADAHGNASTRLALEPAFARLSPDQRIIIVLRFWRDLPVDEIADRLGIPAGTVKSRLHYALRSLRAALESDEEAKP
jgi:RNA polymerase sigma-70 factor, ECF subfamily